MTAFQHRTYPVRPPPLAQGRETKRHKVLIIGGGPVGLAVALGLARQGIASTVIEADTQVCSGSRAICLSRRSFEILDRLGALAPFLEKGLGWTAGRSFHGAREVLRFEMPQDADQRLLPMTNLQQYYIEQFLVDAASRHADLIEIRWGTRLEGLAQSAEGVDVTLAADGKSFSAETDWLVACDGARSAVRQALDLKLNGTAYEGRYVIVDIELALDWPTERLCWFDPPSNPGRTMLMHKQPDDVWRLDYQLHADEDAEAMIAPEKVRPVIERHLAMLGISLPWKLIWTSSYRASALSLDSYGQGRVLFAGDAAHLVPIFGVRGLNSGFDDAFNLAWKLAAAIEGRAGPGLLPSYSTERHLAWRTNIAHAMKSTEFMAPPSRGYELLRDAVLGLSPEHPALAALINPRQSSVIDYGPDGLGTLTPDEASFKAGPRPGQALPECPLPVCHLSGATHLTQRLGAGFTLIVYGARPELSLPLDGVAVPEGAARFQALYDARPGTCYLVRPDGHVAARWRQVDEAAIRAAMRRAQGH